MVRYLPFVKKVPWESLVARAARVISLNAEMKVLALSDDAQVRFHV
jgi:hypothetical protein